MLNISLCSTIGQFQYIVYITSCGFFLSIRWDFVAKQKDHSQWVANWLDFKWFSIFMCPTSIHLQKPKNQSNQIKSNQIWFRLSDYFHCFSNFTSFNFLCPICSVHCSISIIAAFEMPHTKDVAKMTNMKLWSNFIGSVAFSSFKYYEMLHAAKNKCDIRFAVLTDIQSIYQTMGRKEYSLSWNCIFLFLLISCKL